MPASININDIIDDMEIQSDTHTSYLNKETGMIVMIPPEGLKTTFSTMGSIETGSSFAGKPSKK